ncbi:MAG: hypothetical protein ACREQ5_12385, partial [Candidatus Dormibacteria bacterium]
GDTRVDGNQNAHWSVHDNVFDDFDATGVSNGPGYDSGEAWYGGGGDFYRNVTNSLPQSIDPSYMRSIHDNLFMKASALSISALNDGQGTHAHIINATGGQPVTYLYNNIATHIRGGEGFNTNTDPAGGGTAFQFNNLILDCRAADSGPDGSAAGGCTNGFFPAANSSTANLYLFNNFCEAGDDSGTPSQPCYRISGWNVVNTFNNYTISNLANTIGSVFDVSGNASWNQGTTDTVVQTLAAANAQGYSSAETYEFSPTSANDATVGVGVNETAFCNLMADVDAKAACLQSTTYAVGYDQVNHKVIPSGITPVARPSSGAWDSGPYQFKANAP